MDYVGVKRLLSFSSKRQHEFSPKFFSGIKRKHLIIITICREKHCTGPLINSSLYYSLCSVCFATGPQLREAEGANPPPTPPAAILTPSSFLNCYFVILLYLVFVIY